MKCCPVDTNQDGFINEKNNIKYAGYFYGGETGLYYLNAGFYDPETARFIQEDTYRGGINDPLSLNLYTYSHNNPISYYDPTGHSIKKIGDMFKIAAATAKVVAKAVVIPKAKKTAKTLKEDWQSGVDELKKGGVVSQGFASYSESVGGVLSSKVNDILHPVETLKTSLKTSLINWGTAIIWDWRNADPVTYMYNQMATAGINRGIELKDAIITKDLNSICSMAGRDSVLLAEIGIPLFGTKAISGVLAKSAAKGATSAATATANSNAITSGMDFTKNVPMIYSKGATALATISKVKKGVSTFKSAMGVVSTIKEVNEVITEGAKYGAEQKQLGASGGTKVISNFETVSADALNHSNIGDFTYNPKTGEVSKMKGGGHGQANIDFLEQNGLEYNIEKEYSNGVRVGNVPDHKVKVKRSGMEQSWFPRSWSESDIQTAGEAIVNMSGNTGLADGVAVFGEYNGVRVGVIRTNGKIATVFPDSAMQPGR